MLHCSLIALLFVGCSIHISESVRLASYCREVSSDCICETDANVVVIRCPHQYSILLQVMDRLCLDIAYHGINDTRYLPKLNIPEVRILRFRTYSFWNETSFLTDMLTALAIGKVDTLSFIDHLSPNISKKNNLWLFSEINGLQKLKYQSDSKKIQETIFDAFDALTSLELKVNVDVLPDKLLSQMPNLTNLFIQSERGLNFRNEMLQYAPKLKNITLKMGKMSPYQSLHPYLFANMFELRELHLIHIGAPLPPKLFKNSTNLRYLQITGNECMDRLDANLLVDQINLITLDFHDNELAELTPELFLMLSKLERLDLSENKINVLTSDIFVPLTSLKVLNLNCNPLTIIDPMTFSNTPSLELVEMSSTQFYGSKLYMPYEALLCSSEDVCQYKTKTWTCATQCICWVDRSKMQLNIDCRNCNLEQLPALPNTTLLPTVLKYENNNVALLPKSTDYGYANITELHLANNLISAVQIDQLPTNLTYLDLSYNRISHLSEELIVYLAQRRPSIDLKLAGNPIECDCSAVSLLTYARALPNRIRDLRDVRCASKKFTKTFQQLESIDICPSYWYLVAIIVSASIVVTCVLVAIYFIYQQEIKIWLYNHNFCLWYVSEEELDKHKLYDAFISYSHKDEDFVVQLLPKLEEGPHPFKICLHGRDWLAGDCIPDRIVYTVAESKRVIIILSQNFIDSVWARMEFRIAYQATLEDRRKRIIIILYKDVENMDAIGSELKTYLKVNTYLKWGDPFFWNKLRYAMPHNKRVLKGQKTAAIRLNA